MITIELNDQIVDDMKCIEALRALGLADEVIQELYNASKRRELGCRETNA
jgi:hypothetical protein